MYPPGSSPQRARRSLPGYGRIGAPFGMYRTSALKDAAQYSRMTFETAIVACGKRTAAHSPNLRYARANGPHFPCRRSMLWKVTTTLAFGLHNLGIHASVAGPTP